MRADSDCLFCKIASGEIPAEIVKQSEGFIAFRDIAPKADTHVLIVPVGHYRELGAWVSEGGDSNAMLRFVHEVAEDLGVLPEYQQDRVANGYRLITNVGPGGGQEVVHLHWHLLSGNLPGFPTI